ncbi:hypothetical protein, partial [Klebsiella pneumoniae]|uniref:hypothetical protein n=1 Tax=Klebsiella pneumoniae TaxID=573 RepID=UPI001A922BFF
AHVWMILDAAKDIASCKQDKSIKLTSNAPISTLAAVTASSRLRSGSPELTLVFIVPVTCCIQIHLPRK